MSTYSLISVVDEENVDAPIEDRACEVQITRLTLYPHSYKHNVDASIEDQA